MPDQQAPAADVAEQNDGGETPQNQSATSTEKQDVASMSREQLSALLSAPLDREPKVNDPLEDETGVDPFAEFVEPDPLADEGEEISEEEPGETPEDEPEPEPEPEEEEVAPSENQEVDEPVEATTAKPDGRKRLNIYRKDGDGNFIYSDRERAYMALADENGISLKEAERQLFGDTAQEVKTEKSEEAKKPAVSIADLQAQIVTLKAEKKAAAANLEVEKALEKQDEIYALEKQIEAAEQAEAQAQQQTVSQLQAQINASMDAAIAAYPDIAKEGTELYIAGQREIARMQSVNPSAFNDPEWPETVAAKVAMKLGIARKSDSQTEAKQPAAPKPKPTQPARKARQLPGPGEGTPSAEKPTRGPEQIRAEIAQAEKDRDYPRLAKLINELSS